MKTILRLLLNDLKRDGKRPWTMLLYAALPLCLSLLLIAVFGGHRGSGPAPAINVAVLDLDKDLLSRILRSALVQGDAAQHLRLRFVETSDEGLRLVEKGEVSALVVLPANLTVNLLMGKTNSIELYENPSEQILPKVVRQGVSLLAVGLSGAAEILGDPLTQIRAMIRGNDFPASSSVGDVASASAQKLGGLRTYFFPPLIEFETVPAGVFQTYAITNAISTLP